MTWAPVSGATGYNVYASTNQDDLLGVPVPPLRVQPVSTPTTSATIPGSIVFDPYYLVVTATEAGEEGSASPTVTAPGETDDAVFVGLSVPGAIDSLDTFQQAPTPCANGICDGSPQPQLSIPCSNAGGIWICMPFENYYVQLGPTFTNTGALDWPVTASEIGLGATNDTLNDTLSQAADFLQAPGVPVQQSTTFVDIFTAPAAGTPQQCVTFQMRVNNGGFFGNAVAAVLLHLTENQLRCFQLEGLRDSDAQRALWKNDETRTAADTPSAIDRA